MTHEEQGQNHSDGGRYLLLGTRLPFLSLPHVFSRSTVYSCKKMPWVNYCVETPFPLPVHCSVIVILKTATWLQKKQELNQ